MRAIALATSLATLLAVSLASAQPAPTPRPAPLPAPATPPATAPATPNAPPAVTPATNPPPLPPAPAALPPAPPNLVEDAPVTPVTPVAMGAADAPTVPSATTAPVLFAPASPAFDAIGASPTTISHPTSIQSMGASLLGYIDRNGRVNTGVALEAAPLWLILGDNITLNNWRKSYGDRAISRLTFSFASSANATGLTDISQGLRFVIADGTDPRWDKELEKCVGKALVATLPKRAGGSLPDDSDGDDAPVVDDAGVKKCQDAAKQRADKQMAGKGSVAISTAITEQQGPDGQARLGKYFAWLSALGNLGKGARWLSVLGSARYAFNHPGHELDIAVRLRAGNSTLGISVDGAWTPRTNASDDFKAKAGLVGLNGEARVSDTMWLSATAGGKFGADSGGGPDLFSVLHFKFATESAATITPIKPE